MDDLRTRVVHALHEHSHGPDCPWFNPDDWTPGADAVLAAFAEWLRERAEEEHDPDCKLGRHELGGTGCAHFDARWRRDFALALADEIAPEAG